MPTNKYVYDFKIYIGPLKCASNQGCLPCKVKFDYKVVMNFLTSLHELGHFIVTNNYFTFVKFLGDPLV